MKAPTLSASRLVALLAALSPVLAEWTNLTASHFKLKEGAFSSAIAGLDKALPNVNVRDIIAAINHPNPSSSPKVTGLVAGTAYTWEGSADFDDAGTEKWYPQGITTTADAYAAGEFQGQTAHLVCWHSDKYDDGKRGARVTFVNRGSPRKYRHVLLVQPKGSDDFEAIKGLHAGGLFWYGNLVYVVDTSDGLRVFDLDHMYRVDDSIKDEAGKVGSKYGAYGYRFVLPQVRLYKWQAPPGNTRDLRFSFVSLDRTTVPDSIVVGEYDADSTGRRLVRWDIDYRTRLLKTSGGIATASKAVEHDETKVQGATSIDGKFFLTKSGGDLVTFSWAGGKKTTKDAFPSIPEDLSYEKGKGLWTLTEPPGKRNVFAVDPSKF